MAYRYHGESIGKKLARSQLWIRCRAWLGDRFGKGKYLVLASEHGGDISVLKALGVSARQIVAVDLDERSASACRTLHPDAVVIQGDVADVARTYRGQLDAAFLDFCGHPKDSEIRCIQQVAAHGVRDRAILAWAFMKGREQKALMEGIRESRSTLAPFNEGSVVRAAALQVGADVVEPDGRGVYVYERLHDLLVSARALPFTLARINYHSTDRWQPGVPMTISMKWLFRGTPGSKFEREARRENALWKETMEAATLEAVSDWGELAVTSLADADRQVLEFQFKGRSFLVPMEMSINREFTSIDALLIQAASFERDGLDASGMLNLPKGRLAALRAHRTRGTYGRTGSLRA